MNNTTKITVVSLAALVVVAGIVFALTSKKDITPANVTGNTDTNLIDANVEGEPQVQAPVEVLTPEEAGGVNLIEVVGSDKIEEDYMTNAEKEKMGIDISSRVQVLARDESGAILGFKVLSEGEEPATSITEATGLAEPTIDVETVSEEVNQ